VGNWAASVPFLWVPQALHESPGPDPVLVQPTGTELLWSSAGPGPPREGDRYRRMPTRQVGRY